jgi:hypothetical protein
LIAQVCLNYYLSRLFLKKEISQVATVEKRPIGERTATFGSGAKKDPKWLPLVSQIEELTGDDLLVLEPDDGESLRAVKVQVARAANRAGRKDQVQYGESDGKLEVWLRDRPRQKRGPRKRKAD